MTKTISRLLLAGLLLSTGGCAAWTIPPDGIADNRVCRPGSAVPREDPMAEWYPSYKRWSGGSCARY